VEFFFLLLLFPAERTRDVACGEAEMLQGMMKPFSEALEEK